MNLVRLQPQIDAIYQHLQAIFTDSPLLIVGTGASCALSDRFGMGALTEELIRKMPENDRYWIKICGKLHQGVPLEKALQEERTPERLVDKLIKITGEFLAGYDLEYKIRYHQNDLSIPIEKVIRYLFDWTGDNGYINIITTNYDCLIEHCCDKHHIPLCTGFVNAGNINKRYDWQTAVERMVTLKEEIHRGKRKLKRGVQKHIRLFKLHGSLDWFRDKEMTFSDPSIMYLQNQNFDRQIIVPGDMKYLATHRVPFVEMKEHANQAIRDARGYVFIGYGFNDLHIEDVIKNEIICHQKPALAITRDISENCFRLQTEAPQFWTVSKDKNGSVITRNGITESYLQKNIWQIEMFAAEVLGG